MAMHLHLDMTDPIRCGCDREATAGLMPVDEAVARGLALARPVQGTDRLPLSEATGRVLAGPVRTRTPLPPFDASAMDGYALRTADLLGDGPWRLPVAGRIRAGDPPPPLPPGAALRILTGAPLPSGADAVVPREQVTITPGGIRLAFRPRPGANIRPTGCDLAEGAEILSGGRLVGAREAGALAAAGQARVEVRRRLEVAFLSTGSELVPPGDPLPPGAI